MFQIEFDAQQIESALPDYRYISRLGTGTFATVHLVANRHHHQQLALKKINCFGMGQYQKSGAVNQVRILGSLEHKNIIKIHECLFDNSEDVLYIFMEYACLGDLGHLLDSFKQKRQRIPEAIIWKVISDVSDGLQYLHKNHVIHRDLKPANIFRSSECFKLGDMNVSKIVKNGCFAITRTGSPLYTAPQVWQDAPYNHKCDNWSLGILTYEMCWLKVPYEADSIIELTAKIKKQKIKAIPTCYSSQLLDLIQRMLEINPENRIEIEEIHKIAQEKLRLNLDLSTQNQVEQMMDTIVLPQTQKRWINLPLPPKTKRKGFIDSSSKRSTSKPHQKETVALSNHSGIVLSSEKRSVIIPRSRSRNNSRERGQKVRLPSLQKRISSIESSKRSEKSLKKVQGLPQQNIRHSAKETRASEGK